MEISTIKYYFTLPDIFYSYTPAFTVKAVKNLCQLTKLEKFIYFYPCKKIGRQKFHHTQSQCFRLLLLLRFFFKKKNNFSLQTCIQQAHNSYNVEITSRIKFKTNK
jgi:hypothetical protein